ncbi:hypothetical protein DB42_CT00210 [Neochlamydia sp. EPS4]|nr:hypothetical protein DB42_CT00210 [Neochlamydia sp. EPS4]
MPNFGRVALLFLYQSFYSLKNFKHALIDFTSSEEHPINGLKKGMLISKSFSKRQFLSFYLLKNFKIYILRF